MKINISIEASPEEVRETFGLPNLTKLQSLIMGKLSDQVKDGDIDPNSIMEIVSAKQNIWGKLFMDTALKNLEMMTMASKKSDEKKSGPDQAA